MAIIYQDRVKFSRAPPSVSFKKEAGSAFLYFFTLGNTSLETDCICKMLPMKQSSVKEPFCFCLLWHLAIYCKSLAHKNVTSGTERITKMKVEDVSSSAVSNLCLDIGRVGFQTTHFCIHIASMPIFADLSRNLATAGEFIPVYRYLYFCLYLTSVIHMGQLVHMFHLYSNIFFERHRCFRSRE